MRHTPHYLMTDPDEVRRLIRNHPWATIVSPASTGLVASHYPVILDESPDGPGISILSHVGRPDDRLHELGRHEVLFIVQGPHDYISPSWYAPGDLVPTWNHVTAHLYGTPEILDEEENYAALSLLTDHFERDRPGGRSLAEDEAATRREARGAVSFRLRVDRFDARAKLSQNKAPEVVDHVIERVGEDNPGLAEEMRRVRDCSREE
ncbi:FMN-binding negative transcriptional regulator [Ornithinimicrobium kibberense]|uniref:FMN-binding negative transcriptional regulator n=2 Tax=Ornithinimicrobium kibberense TaxID=282060 RepID=A0ABV5V5Z4_9MICO|nr:FMN-binding negative transcriptional regulator [Ornithinimicrobium kibberense]